MNFSDLRNEILQVTPTHPLMHRRCESRQKNISKQLHVPTEAFVGLDILESYRVRKYS